MSPERWQELMHALGLPPGEATFEALRRAYAERHRHYHSAEHIDECLVLLDALRERAVNPQAVELAIWFHDAIYAPRRTDNEARSADWAEGFLREAGAHTGLSTQVRELILATRHEAGSTSDSGDAALLVDIDLAILGAEPERYARYETDIRREYRWVPGPLYRRARRALLQGFLERPRLYATDALHSQREARARANLTAALARLRNAASGA